MREQNLISLINERREQIEQWFEKEWQQTPPLFYGSIDLRNAGFKLSPVDTNLFPAGFNNLSPEAIELGAKAIQAYMKAYYPSETQILLIPESHTRNNFYFDNLTQLLNMFKLAGLEVRLASLNSEADYDTQLKFETLLRKDHKVGVEGFFPKLVLLNNDLSSGVPEILQNLEQTILPPLFLGWHNRLKSTHFDYYSQLCQSFAQKFDFDPWLIMPLFDHCNEIDFLKRKGEGCLAFRAEKLLFQIEKKYQEYGINQKPFLIVKADSGTYGMGVMTVKDPKELLQLNRKQRTKMSASKGGKEVHAAIIQEGIPTIEKWNESSTAESVLYGIGSEVIGGFYRAHETRDSTESLNTPGMHFHAFSKENPKELYSYQVITRLALLAAAHEKQGE
ncbi:MAG TPA: glutamate--cysteine ligase [Coxiellaceae bacterium]|nr:glutamate--cysteine ligase [Coxiellaceae bacterium]